MSGTFNEIDVPPTLVSFAVDVAESDEIITPEFKKAGNLIILYRIHRDEYDLPIYSETKQLYEEIHNLIQEGVVVSAYALDGKGVLPAISKMAFGNKFGVRLTGDFSVADFFEPAIGDMLLEIRADSLERIRPFFALLGEVTADGVFRYQDVEIPVDEAIAAWSRPLEKVFPTKSGQSSEAVDSSLYREPKMYVCKHKVAKPTVFIPVFPGTNCEYDTAKAFERAGASVVTKVFCNLTAQDILDSVSVFEKEIEQAQIIMFPGGFSAGDEPDGSAKFFATAFQNAKLKEAVERLLNERDGLALGICNGFQALIKLGLVPNGAITGQNEQSPTLTFNTINRHISKMAYLKVVSNKSPWLAGARLGSVYVNPASHGEGRFVAPPEVLRSLFENGQVATQYSDPDGVVSMDEEWNINGSFAAVEGITSPDGRCLGKMAHSERRGDSVAINIEGNQDLRIFESGVAYFQ